MWEGASALSNPPPISPLSLYPSLYWISRGRLAWLGLALLEGVAILCLQEA